MSMKTPAQYMMEMSPVMQNLGFTKDDEYVVYIFMHHLENNTLGALMRENPDGVLEALLIDKSGPNYEPARKMLTDPGYRARIENLWKENLAQLRRRDD